jgi:SAM-dependent methyltransferase
MTTYSPAMEKRDRIKTYAGTYLADYGFEATLVEARQRLILELLEHRRPRRILEAGCGAQLISEKAAAAGIPFDRWIVIEPAGDFVEIVEAFARREPRVAVRCGFFEDEVAPLLEQEGSFDLVLLSGLLGELADPASALRAARDAVGKSGVVHINVPNAYSLHRRLARAMGLISDEHDMSDRNKALRQYRNYDPDSLRADVEAAGLRVQESGGYFLKPFTHAQMEDVTRLLGHEILPGLWQLGRELPELASEIFVNAVRAP